MKTSAEVIRKATLIPSIMTKFKDLQHNFWVLLADKMKGLVITMDSQNQNYRNMRALMLLRVSTPKQEEGYGWPSQEKECREKLIEPLGLKLVDTIRDTYSGLEFRERPVLDQILEKAKRNEFDIVVMDVLDRLGRKGLEREIWRMQLRATGVKMLTTKLDEHADDDSSWGELIRIFKGIQSEDELNNIKRRTTNGKRAKAEGRQQDGTIGTQKIVGNGPRLYGYKYIYDENGKRAGYTPNYDVLLIEESGEEWTEVKVVIFIFESAATGVSNRQIANILNARNIPTASEVRGTKIRRNGPPLWQPSVINKTLHNSAYWGKFRQFRYNMGEKLPGRKKKQVLDTPEEKQIIIEIPALISVELAEVIQRKLKQNKEDANRNNRKPRMTLLRSGLAKCGLCGGNMSASRKTVLHVDGTTKDCFGYICNRRYGLVGRCAGCWLQATLVDNASWEKTLDIIRDPSEVDKKLDVLRSQDPTSDRRKNINKKLKEIRDEQDALQDYLSERIRKRKLDEKTEESLTGQLHHLAEQEKILINILSENEDIHEKWKKVQKKLDDLHEKCAEMREKMSDHNYESSYDEKRDLLKFFGINAIIYGSKAKPQFEIKCNPPDIMSLIS